MVQDTGTARTLLLGCLSCLLMTAVVSADGRVFVLELRNSSGPLAFRDAEQACASRQARLASAEELRHAVVECFFSSCTRGWMHGGAVGTTVCSVEGSALKAVDVRTENASEDTSQLDAFCITENGVPCGDPPSFPNARLQGHPGFQMGDELLYMCVPGYAMPRGQSAFSLLCDSCGEWYGLVQICVPDGSEVHVDYEDRLPDSHEEHLEGKPEATRDQMYEEVDGTEHWKGKTSQEQHGTGLGVKAEQGEQEARGEVVDLEESIESKEKDEEWAVQDFTGHPTWEQESREVVRTDAPAATEAPVSLLSQKHMFWFPSEAFQEEGLPVSTNPVTQSTQRASGGQSEESKEQESQERRQHQDRDGDDGRGVETQEDHDDSRHEQDDTDSRQEEDDHVQPVQPEDDEDEHIHRDSQEHDERDDADGTHESHEDHHDVTDDPGDLHASEEHLDLDDHDDDLNERDDDRYADHGAQEDHDSYDDLDSQEHDGHKRVIFSIAPNQRGNITQKKTGGKSTTDETWLDGYPVVPQETDSATERVRPGDRQRGTALRSTDRPNEVEIRRPGAPEAPRSSTMEPELVEEVWDGFIPTGPSPDHPEPSDSHSGPDTQQAAPTGSWLGGLTQPPFLDHDLSPPEHNNDILAGVVEEHTMHSLPGEAGERGEMEGERGEAVCTGESCPPSSLGRGPRVAAIIVAVLAVATAVVVGVWCYRRQQQKSSMYEMNGKGQNPNSAGQQMEMQQKV